MISIRAACVHFIKHHLAFKLMMVERREFLSNAATGGCSTKADHAQKAEVHAWTCMHNVPSTAAVGKAGHEYLEAMQLPQTGSM